MATFTPGPWIYDGNNSITADSDSVGICILEPLEEFWCGDVAHPQGKQYEANAYLIAAAPDLFAACRAFLAWNDLDQGTGKLEDALALARAAVEKAI